MKPFKSEVRGLKGAIVALAILQGCTFSAPQFESAFRLAKSFGNIVHHDSDAKNTQHSSTWLASVGDHGAVLQPYAVNELIVFANVDGDAVSFDGWTIRSITGFGLSEPLSISGKDGPRLFVYDGIKSVTECDPWLFLERAWKQVCANGNGTILLDQHGNIELISMSLGESHGIVSLRVVKQVANGAN